MRNRQNYPPPQLLPTPLHIQYDTAFKLTDLLYSFQAKILQKQYVYKDCS